MNLNIQHLNWVGNIYQTFEAVCQEVDDIVGQDAVKYLENQVQNVGDSMKKFYSGVVHEILPFPTLPSSKYEAHSVAVTNSDGFSVESFASHKDNNKKRDEENPISNFSKSLQDSNATDIDNSNNQQAGVPMPSSKYEAHSVAVTNSDGFSVESFASHKDNNKKRDEENPINNFSKSLQDSNATDIDNSNNQQAGVPVEHNLVNQVIDEICSDFREVEDSYMTQEEVGDDSRETSGAKKENLHTSIEEVAVESVPKPMNLISFSEKEPLEFPTHSESYSYSSDSGCEGSIIRTKDGIDVNDRQNSCLIVEENATNSSTSQVLSSKFISSSPSLDEKESVKASLFSELSDVIDEDTHGTLAEVSPEASVSSERPFTKTEPLCLRCSSTSDSLYSNSLGSFSFEIESCKNNSGDATLCISDSSMVHRCCETSHHVAGQIMESQDRLVFSGYCQSMGSNDEAPFSSIESGLEDIKLNDDPKLEESCIFVDDSELYAVSSRAQKLRPYKKRIRDAFTSKKRLAKEYEQLAIWYGDTDIEPNQRSSQTLSQFSSRTYTDSNVQQVQHASETEWELL